MSEVKRNELMNTIIAIIGTVGVCAAFAIMPGLAKAIPVFGTRKSYVQKRDLRRVLKRLKNLELIEAHAGRNDKEYVKLTRLGERVFALYELKNKPSSPPKRWDKMWRVVIFDIPEKYRHKRERLRKLLLTSGFMRLQDSVWVYPYECEDIIELLKIALQMRFECIYLTCKRFHSDRWLCRQFGLKKYCKKS